MMSRPRFYLESLAVGVVALDQTESRHALASLRLCPGDQAELFDGKGNWAVGTLQPQGSVDKRSTRRPAAFAIQEIVREPPTSPTLELIVPGCKGPRLPWMIEKLTELGTVRIVLANFERSVVRVSAGHANKLRRTALEAAKQSGRAWLPQIFAGVALEDAVQIGTPPDRPPPRLFVAHPAAGAAPAADEISACVRGRIDLCVVIGPEGGLTEAELTRLTASAGRPIRLAPYILRVETAALTVAALWAGHM